MELAFVSREILQTAHNFTSQGPWITYDAPWEHATRFPHVHNGSWNSFRAHSNISPLTDSGIWENVFQSSKMFFLQFLIFCTGPKRIQHIQYRLILDFFYICLGAVNQCTEPYPLLNQPCTGKDICWQPSRCRGGKAPHPDGIQAPWGSIRIASVRKGLVEAQVTCILILKRMRFTLMGLHIQTGQGEEHLSCLLPLWPGHML